jgi:hypothetical protein
VTIVTTLYDALAVGVSDRRPLKELASMISRPLAALASLILTVLGIVFLLPDCAYACSCAPASTQRYISGSGAVFSAVVVEVEEGPPTKMMGTSGIRSSRVTLRASEVWKGPQRETLEVSTPRDGATCGYHFKEGQEYLVFAYTEKQGLVVDSCNGTRRLAEAEAALKVLGIGEKPAGGGVLSDTSGGASVRAMMGVAGLALAASVLAMVRLVRVGQTKRR